MIDGTYHVEAKTPLGTKDGSLVLATAGSTCTADLTVAGKTKRLEGTLSGETATFEGSVKLPFPFGTQHFQLVGSVTGDQLFGTCRTKKFSFDVSGTRVG